MLDEYLYEHTSLMVDRVRYDSGDPRFYLAELKPSRQSNMWGEDENAVFLHRMPYMKMEKSIITKANVILYLLMMCFASTYSFFNDFFDFFITF